ncbi:hypothetical protein DFP73DRAFT_559349 [Morchella snyderi]|nr:hypothetical protein DFP73DRAFT_559349 [Morchella snyderi]
MAPIGIAILGSGNFVRNQHKPAVEACTNFSLKAIYSRSKASASALLAESSNVEIYSDDSGAGHDLDALLAREDIHAIIIALPIPLQPEIIKKCLLASKHVLSEKPIAPTRALALELIAWRHANIPASTHWGVAENMRFQNGWRYAAETIRTLGRVLSFRVETGNMISPGGPTFETTWRKTPAYQGGYLLDGGVHYTAIIQIMLGDDRVDRVAAFTTRLQEHLPPVDTVDAVWRTKAGVQGTFSSSFGTTVKKFDYVVVCEKGVVTATWDKVTVQRGAEIEVREFPEDGSGVKQEVAAFSEAILKGTADERQAPELAYRDLDIIETMLRSGEQDGATLKISGEFS